MVGTNPAQGSAGIINDHKSLILQITANRICCYRNYSGAYG